MNTWCHRPISGVLLDTGPSAAMARVAVRLLVFGCPSPFGCACFGAFAGWHERQLMLRKLTRRSCPNGSAQPSSEFGGAPRKRPDAGCPVAQRRGRRQQARRSLVTFCRWTESYCAAGRITRHPACDKKRAPNTVGVVWSKTTEQNAPSRPTIPPQRSQGLAPPPAPAPRQSTLPP